MVAMRSINGGKFVASTNVTTNNLLLIHPVWQAPDSGSSRHVMRSGHIEAEEGTIQNSSHDEGGRTPPAGRPGGRPEQTVGADAGSCEFCAETREENSEDRRAAMGYGLSRLEGGMGAA